MAVPKPPVGGRGAARSTLRPSHNELLPSTVEGTNPYAFNRSTGRSPLRVRDTTSPTSTHSPKGVHASDPAGVAASVWMATPQDRMRASATVSSAEDYHDGTPPAWMGPVLERLQVSPFGCVLARDVWMCVGDGGRRPRFPRHAASVGRAGAGAPAKRASRPSD